MKLIESRKQLYVKFPMFDCNMNSFHLAMFGESAYENFWFTTGSQNGHQFQSTTQRRCTHFDCAAKFVLESVPNFF